MLQIFDFYVSEPRQRTAFLKENVEGTDVSCVQGLPVALFTLGQYHGEREKSPLSANILHAAAKRNWATRASSGNFSHKEGKY